MNWPLHWCYCTILTERSLLVRNLPSSYLGNKNRSNWYWSRNRYCNSHHSYHWNQLMTFLSLLFFCKADFQIKLNLSQVIILTIWKITIRKFAGKHNSAFSKIRSLNTPEWQFYRKVCDDLKFEKLAEPKMLNINYWNFCMVSLCFKISI